MTLDVESCPVIVRECLLPEAAALQAAPNRPQASASGAATLSSPGASPTSQSTSYESLDEAEAALLSAAAAAAAEKKEEEEEEEAGEEAGEGVDGAEEEEEEEVEDHEYGENVEK